MADNDVNGKIKYHSEKLAEIKKLLG
jgi:hypothetical protein